MKGEQRKEEVRRRYPRFDGHLKRGHNTHEFKQEAVRRLKEP
ncbi:MAG: hypothetical protein XU15_C0004G0077 [candidate division NC10 bacterium CSP1-5]|nr:MAG: hypothetical protein XU15_C0004G0077 [candidate division NC10 bacterium CSP1-5]